jgi:anti-sigma regulatory factor (Ser/Thr protein kinase)
MQDRLQYKRLIHPMEQLIEGMNIISKGNLDYRIPVIHIDELGRFIASFNSMVQELKKSKTDLENELVQTKNQREKIFKVYSDVINAVTQGKMMLLRPEDIALTVISGIVIAETMIKAPEDVSIARKISKTVVREMFSNRNKDQKILLCVSEAATNIIKHAGSGIFTVRKEGPDTLWFVFTDNGTGMDFDNLPAKIFYKGFSTKVSMGYGFNLIFSMVDKLILATSKNGTTVAFAFNNQSTEETT